MKNAIKLAVLSVIILMLAVGATGCISSNNNPNNPTNPTTAPVATATAAPSQATVKPTAAPTKTPTATPTDSNIAGIEQNFVSKGYTIVTHFTKTTFDGKVAYKGTVKDSSGSYKITAILTSTQAEATSYADSLLAQYKAKGFTVDSDNGNYQYILSQGYTTAGIAAYSVVYGTGSPGVAILEEA